jgi:hypothetical protein
MAYLAEDCTYLAGAFLLLAAVFLAALRITQQGKYLIWGMVAFGLGVGVVVTEWLWVTDNERIEQAVYSLRGAVLNSDVDGVFAELAPDAQYSQGQIVLPPEATRSLIRMKLGYSHFDFIRISQLQISVAEQARRGKAEFRVLAKATLNPASGTVSAGTAPSSWSLGFRETKPGVWKVYRITPLSAPQDVLAVLDGPVTPGQVGLGFFGGVHTP